MRVFIQNRSGKPQTGQAKGKAGLGRLIDIQPTQSKGKGGEAEVFSIGNNLAAKIFKDPSHPDFDLLPQDQKIKEQQGARERLKEHQEKLPKFPTNLPRLVITPQDMVWDQGQKQIIGYTMTFLDKAASLLNYSEKSFRQAGVDNAQVITVFQTIRNIVKELHTKGVIIGDFNELNVLIQSIAGVTHPYFIDADSFQFGQFLCKVYTVKFLDPLLADPTNKVLALGKPYNQNSDWYAYAVLLMKSLIYTDPYGGTHKPKAGPKLSPAARPLTRLTIFDNTIRYPGNALPYNLLPDDLLHEFHQVFEKDKRGEFPEKLLNITWTKCTQCGNEHGKSICPVCHKIAVFPTGLVTRVHGQVTVTDIFKTSGIILQAQVGENGLMKWLYHDQGKFIRETKQVVMTGNLNPFFLYRLTPKSTIVGRDTELLIIDDKGQMKKKMVDQYQNKPVFDTNQQGQLFWIQGGQITKEVSVGNGLIVSDTAVGDVLTNLTKMWVGKTTSGFGAGFYRAGGLGSIFTFDFERKGILEFDLPGVLRGKLSDAICYFGKDEFYLLTTTHEQGTVINRAFHYKRNGQLLATAEEQAGQDTWLGTIRGKAVIGKFLFSVSDHGILRVESQQGQIATTKIFEDTEPFVKTGDHLQVGNGGLYVTNSKEIKLLKLG
jgi:hypothetical protein